MPSLPRPSLRRNVALGALLAAGCAPYMRTDMPAPRRTGVLDALASLVGACGAPDLGDAGAGAPERAPGTDGREPRRCDAKDDRTDGVTTPTPVGPTQKKP